MKLLEALNDPFLRPMTLDALAAGAFVVIMCGVLSPFVVVKRLGFVGQGVSHSAFGGIGIASVLAAVGLIGQGTLLEFAVIITFCVAAALLMAGISGRKSLPEDSAIGMVLVGAMALGAILVQVSPAIARSHEVSFTPQGWESILFGSILLAGPRDVLTAGFLCAAVLAVLFHWRRPMTFAVFDEDAATAFGVPAARMRILLMVLLAVAVVTAMKVAGVVLATAMLVFPGATALRLGNRLATVIGLSVLLAVVSLVAGIAIAMEFDWQAGPSVVLAMGLLFAIALLRPRKG